eukprot:scaffold3488_cov23-Cyclotella_meneghiniana.AAC.1
MNCPPSGGVAPLLLLLAESCRIRLPVLRSALGQMLARIYLQPSSLTISVLTVVVERRRVMVSTVR